MGDVVLNSQQLRGVATDITNAVSTIPTSSPLAMGSVSASDVTAASNDFNLWATYTALVTRAQLNALAESTSGAALLLEQYEAELAANATGV